MSALRQRERRDLAETYVQRGGKEFCSWTRTHLKEIGGWEWGKRTFSPFGEGWKDSAEVQPLAPHCPHPKESPPSPRKSAKAPQTLEDWGPLAEASTVTIATPGAAWGCAWNIGVTPEHMSSPAAPRRAPGGHLQQTPSNSWENLWGGAVKLA